MIIEPLQGFDYPPFLIPQADGVSFALWEEVCYTAKDGDSWDIPEGFRTDFATIPAIVSWAVPKLGAYTLAAIVHDLLCEGLKAWHRALRAVSKGQAAYHFAPWSEVSHGVHTSPMVGIRIDSTGEIVARPTADSVDADAIFRRIALDHGTNRVTARLLWLGVRYGALFSAHRRGGFLRTLLPFLGWSVVFAPVLLPASLVVGVTQLLLGLFRRLAR